MPFKFFGGRNKTLLSSQIEKQRKNYVMVNAVSSQPLAPCEKFVAVYEKLTHNFTLCLADPSEKIKTAGISVLEFNEGYDLREDNTHNLREKVVLLTKQAYFLTIRLIQVLSVLEQTIESKQTVNDIKMDARVISDVMLNVYKHLSMNDEIPKLNDDDFELNENDALNIAIQIINQIVNVLITLNDSINIEYINKQLNSIILKFTSFRNVLNSIK